MGVCTLHYKLWNTKIDCFISEQFIIFENLISTALLQTRCILLSFSSSVEQDLKNSYHEHEVLHLMFAGVSCMLLRVLLEQDW